MSHTILDKTFHKIRNLKGFGVMGLVYLHLACAPPQASRPPEPKPFSQLRSLEDAHQALKGTVWVSRETYTGGSFVMLLVFSNDGRQVFWTNTNQEHAKEQARLLQERSLKYDPLVDSGTQDGRFLLTCHPDGNTFTFELSHRDGKNLIVGTIKMPSGTFLRTFELLKR